MDKQGGLRILILEDNPDDIVLMEEELKRSGFACALRRVQSREDYEAALAGPDIDAVVSDYKLPGFDGVEALEARNRLRPEVPFVFFSGTIGEQRAVDALKAGATDYVLKDRPDRLAPTLRRALAEGAERTARRRAEEALRRSEARFRTLVENSNDLFWELDASGRYSYVSPNVRSLWGYEPAELIGNTPYSFMPPEEAARVRRIFEPYMAERRPFSLLSHKLRLKKGGLALFECSGRPSFDADGGFRGYHGVDRDITERRRLEDELRQSEKMASVGLLIGGVAHELNNPLMGILGHAQLLLAESVSGQTREDLEIIEREAKRCKRLIKSLLTFARREEHQFQLADVNALVREIVELKSYDLRRAGVALELDLAEGLPSLRVDPNQVQQVLLNLLTNAQQAMELAGASLKERKVVVRSRRDAGSVLLSVADSGPGIPADVLPRIFDPFFTTKEAGKGTGLGLSICVEIAKEHGGDLAVESPPGQGARFVLRLPETALPSPALRAPSPGSAGRGEGARGTTLVVDDDEMVLRFIARALAQEGWAVDSHSDPLRALEALRAREFDLVIADFHMPGMDGAGFCRQAAALRPALLGRFLVCTAAPYVEEARSFAEPAGIPVLLKPFDLEEFKKVLETLGIGRSAGASA